MQITKKQLKDMLAQAEERGREKVIEEISESLKKSPLTTNDDYNPDTERNYVGVKEMLNYLQALKKQNK